MAQWVKNPPVNAGDTGDMNLIPGSGRFPGERIGYPVQYSWASLVTPTCNAEKPGFNPWVGKIPWKRKWQPAPVLLPGKPHGWRILAGYSSWGHRVRHD